LTIFRISAKGEGRIVSTGLDDGAIGGGNDKSGGADEGVTEEELEEVELDINSQSSE
jgi:hypothetical protein